LRSGGGKGRKFTGPEPDFQSKLGVPAPAPDFRHIGPRRPHPCSAWSVRHRLGSNHPIVETWVTKSDLVIATYVELSVNRVWVIGE